MGETSTKTLRSVELPKLDGASTAIEFGDWLTVIRQMIGEACWWEITTTAVEQSYHQWLHADPLDMIMRLRMALLVPDAARGWPRTENRVAGMLLEATPTGIYSEVVASGKMTTTQVIFKLYTIFQAGGQTERTSLLQLLVDWKSPSNNAAEMADSIQMEKVGRLS